MSARRTLALATIALLPLAAWPGTGPSHASPAYSPSPRGVLYAGLQDGSLYRSTDSGSTWQEADSGLPSGTAISELAVSPGSGSLVYAGTSGYGVYLSTNGGTSWQDDNSGDYTLQNATVAGLVLDQSSPRNVFALTSDNQFHYIAYSGTSYSTALPISRSGSALAVNPRDGNMLFAGSVDGGIFRSTDRGRTWRNTADGSLGEIFAFAFNARNPIVAYAATADGIYQTIDSGNSWLPERRGIPGGTQFTTVAVNPNNSVVAVAGTVDGQIYRTVDGGTSWRQAGSAYANRVNAFFFDPLRSGSVLAGVDGGSGLVRSDDQGATWYAINSLGGNGVVESLAGASRPALPTDPVPAPLGNPAGVRYFSASHHAVRGSFLSYYTANNGLKIFGLPLTESFTEGAHLVQYFERVRMVYDRGRVTLTPLGSQVTAGRRFAAGPCCGNAGQMWFSSTHHTLSGVFLTFWKSHNSSVLFGAPISQPVREQNGDGTGRTYLVQYFQNARMEYHPELAGTENIVTLGQLGRQVLHQRGWI